LAFDGLLGAGRAVPDIVSDRVGEEGGLLLDEADERAQRTHVPFAHIDAVDEHGALVDVVYSPD
jgi:hypothetical protein